MWSLARLYTFYVPIVTSDCSVQIEFTFKPTKCTGRSWCIDSVLARWVGLSGLSQKVISKWPCRLGLGASPVIEYRVITMVRGPPWLEKAAFKKGSQNSFGFPFQRQSSSLGSLLVCPLMTNFSPATLRKTGLIPSWDTLGALWHATLAAWKLCDVGTVLGVRSRGTECQGGGLSPSPWGRSKTTPTVACGDSGGSH